MTKPSRYTIALLPLLLGGCFFATKSDVDKLQADMIGTRAGANAADSVQRAYLVDLSRNMRSLNDSISALSRRMNAMKTASDADLAAIREDISQLQVGGGPGPAQLLQAGRDQLLKGGNVAARAAFSQLISTYPRSDLVPEAMFYTAQAYAAERNADAADKEYASLITRYPNSPRVPTAMYKRALQMQATKKTADAKRLFQEIIKRFPRSDEAALADERLQSIK
jgi:tol-pal system protein YbgF